MRVILRGFLHGREGATLFELILLVCVGVSDADLHCNVLRHSNTFNNVQVCRMTKIMEEELFSVTLERDYPAVRVVGYCREADSA